MLSAGVAWRLPPVRPPALPLGSSPVCGVMCCAACCVVYTRSVVGVMWLGFVLTNLVVGSHGCFVRVGCGVSLTPLVLLHNALSNRYGLACGGMSLEEIISSKDKRTQDTYLRVPIEDSCLSAKLGRIRTDKIIDEVYQCSSKWAKTRFMKSIRLPLHPLAPPRSTAA